MKVVFALVATMFGVAWSAQPLLELSHEGNQVVVSFTGTLQSSPSVDGVWADVEGASSPTILDLAGARRFYRSLTPVTESIFSSRSVVEWVVTGPLQTHFNLAFAGSPDGIFPPRREKPYFDGRLQMSGVDVPVTLRVRGNSSLQECPFAKLKVKIDKDHRTNTPFADAREIKIGTHCADGGQGNIGRLRDERATFREALAYETMDLLGFTSPRVRRARIEFRDTSPTNAPVDGGWQITRHAFIFDDVEVIAERLGGRALADSEVEAVNESDFNQQLLIDLHFLHVLLGNWDYALSLDGEGFWNTDVIELADGTRIPVAGDFDLSSWVTEQVRLSAPRDYHPEWSDRDREARYRLGQLRQRVKPEIFEAARARFSVKRQAMELLVQNAEVDDIGRTNALNHVATFFAALANPGD